MEVFYINLDKDVARRESMERQLTELGLSYQRIEAVYGRDLSKEQLRECYSSQTALRRQSRELSLAEIGCAMSHIQVMRQIVASDLPMALILEDDVILTDQVVEAMNDLQRLIDPNRPEVLLLSPTLGQAAGDGVVRQQGSYRAAPFVGGYFTSSYIVTHSAAQSMLKELHPVGDVADCWARLNRFKVVDLFALQPHLIEQEQETFGSSTTADFKPFANSFTKALYKLRRLRCVLLDRLSASWRRRFHPYNDVLKKMIRPSRIYLVTKLFRLIPETRGFALKARLLKWAGVQLGREVRVCSSVAILGAGALEIGDRTWLGHQALIVCSSKVVIGADVDIAPRVYIGTGTHQLDAVGPRSAGAGMSQAVVIGDGAWLGAGCIILPGVTIGEKAVVAAGALVRGDVIPRSIVAGVPAREVGTIDHKKGIL